MNPTTIAAVLAALCLIASPADARRHTNLDPVAAAPTCPETSCHLGPQTALRAPGASRGYRHKARRAKTHRRPSLARHGAIRADVRRKSAKSAKSSRPAPNRAITEPSPANAPTSKPIAAVAGLPVAPTISAPFPAGPISGPLMANAGHSVGLVREARRYLGSDWRPFGRRTLWCAVFANHVLRKLGYRGTGSALARSFASYGVRVSGPQVGSIAVMSRGRRGGHVGIVSGVTRRGVVVISGNHGRRVAESVYPRGMIYAYVVPR